MDRVARSKAEILFDAARGTVPEDVATFAGLHDHVDANEYGGLCEDGFVGSDGWVDEANRIQEAVDDWIRSGAVKRLLDAPAKGSNVPLRALLRTMDASPETIARLAGIE
jgi:hypothetical protein